jgi:hypothetical protein
MFYAYLTDGRQFPLSCFADMLGYKASTMLRRAGEGATDWATYAATKASRATSPISAR